MKELRKCSQNIVATLQTELVTVDFGAGFASSPVATSFAVLAAKGMGGVTRTSLLTQAGKALLSFHQTGWVHGDPRLANLMQAESKQRQTFWIDVGDAELISGPLSVNRDVTRFVKSCLGDIPISDLLLSLLHWIVRGRTDTGTYRSFAGGNVLSSRQQR